MEIIVEVLAGLLIACCGYQLAFKQNFRVLRDFHYRKVTEADKPVFARVVGTGNLLSGLGIFLMPVVNLVFQTTAGYWLGMGLLAAGIVTSVIGIVKYNYKWF